VSGPASALNLEGRTAVVLGGTSGIGRAISLGLATAGADVVAAGRRAAEVAATADAIEAAGRKALRQTADVTNRASLEALRDATLAAFGKVDILVNCAGKTKRLPAMDYDDASWNDILDTNLTGTLRGCQIFGKPMLERGYGRIINIASLTVFVAFHETAPYGASKAAVGALTKSLAIEWGPRGVMVNAIAPGVFRTAINAEVLDGTERGREIKLRTPGGRFGKVEEIAGAAVFLASESASFVNGHILAVDGGYLASGVNQ
jgi:NAD(P)-dependent dehydrogenase (short-subunit alcohol dehydrogenase family)